MSGGRGGEWEEEGKVNEKKKGKEGKRMQITTKNKK